VPLWQPSMKSTPMCIDVAARNTVRSSNLRDAVSQLGNVSMTIFAAVFRQGT
jgi:hypothetical protein